MFAKTLALIVFHSTEAAWLLPMAASVAFSLNAHLTVLQPFSPVVFFDGIVAEPTFYASIQSWDASASEKISGLVEHHTGANSVQSVYPLQKDLYVAEPFLLSLARGADLVILGPNKAPGRSPDDRGLVERLIRRVVRPVLVLDKTSQSVLPTGQFVIGWGDTRKAMRAALTLAAPGATIELVSVLANAHEDVPVLDAREDLTLAFDRVGFQVTVIDRSATAGDWAAEVVCVARDGVADLLAMGVFGHSRLYNFAIDAGLASILNTRR